MLFNLLWSAKPLFTVSTRVFFSVCKNSHSKPQHCLQCLSLGPLWMRLSMLQKCSCLDLIWEDVSNQDFTQNILITLFMNSVSSGTFEKYNKKYFLGMRRHVAFPVSGGDMETWRPGCSPELMRTALQTLLHKYLWVVIYKIFLLAC